MDFVSLAMQCAPTVAPLTMAAIVKTESAFNQLAIGVNGGARLVRQAGSIAEAVVTAKWLLDRGYNIDLGLAQVNSNNLSKTGLTIEGAFDPCKNLAAAASILTGNFQAAKGKTPGDQAALHAAVSAYNTGSFTKGFQNGYVQKVLNNAGSAVPAIAPIPLMRKAAGRQDAQAKGQAPVRLSAGELEQGTASNVFGTDTRRAMVY
jgi:type IV secretion system protein VirB1